jgi:hypothetical protein
MSDDDENAPIIARSPQHPVATQVGVEGDSAPSRRTDPGWVRFIYCGSVCCFRMPRWSYPASGAAGSPTAAGRVAAADNAAAAVAADEGTAATTRSWFRIPWSSKAADSFNPGPGYQRMPLNFTVASSLDDGGNSDENDDRSVEPRSGMPSALNSTETPGGNLSATIKRAAASASSIGGLSRTRAASHAEAHDTSDSAPQSPSSSSSFADRMDQLSRLAAVEVRVKRAAATHGSTNGLVLTISGPLKGDYAFRAGSAIAELVAEGNYAAARRQMPYLFDEAGVPLNPIAAMDSLEDVVLGALADPSRRRVHASDAPVVVAVEVVGLNLGDAHSHAGAALSRSKRQPTSSLDEAEVAKRRSLRKDATVRDILPLIAREFADDYEPKDVKTRAMLFIESVLSCASSVHLADLAVSDCAFPSPTDFGAFLTADWCPRATRNPATGAWSPALQSIEVRNCGITTAHVTALVRQLNKTHNVDSLPSVVVAERLTLLGQYDGQSISALLGFIADVFPDAPEGDRDDGEDVSVLLPSDGLHELNVSDRVLAEVREHRIIPRVQRLNGKLLR